jgi:hypothetical protein
LVEPSSPLLELTLPTGVVVPFPPGTEPSYLRALIAELQPVIPIPRSARIFIGSTPIDLPISIGGLMAIVQDELRQDVLGHLFVFVSRRCDRVTILT